MRVFFFFFLQCMELLQRVDLCRLAWTSCLIQSAILLLLRNLHVLNLLHTSSAFSFELVVVLHGFLIVLMLLLYP